MFSAVAAPSFVFVESSRDGASSKPKRSAFGRDAVDANVSPFSGVRKIRVVPLFLCLRDPRNPRYSALYTGLSLSFRL